METKTTLVHLQRTGLRVFSPVFGRAQGQLACLRTDLVTPMTMATREKWSKHTAAFVVTSFRYERQILLSGGYPK